LFQCYAHNYKLAQQNVQLTRLIRKAQDPEAKPSKGRNHSEMILPYIQCQQSKTPKSCMCMQSAQSCQNSCRVCHSATNWLLGRGLAAGLTLSDHSALWGARLQHRSHEHLSSNCHVRWMFPTVGPTLFRPLGSTTDRRTAHFLVELLSTGMIAVMHLCRQMQTCSAAPD
jgi:hypothetical protein